MMVGKNRAVPHTVSRIPQGSIGAELGVWRGDSSVLFLQKAKHLHLVDAWSTEAFEEYLSEDGLENYYKKYGDELVHYKDKENFNKYYDNVYEKVRKRFINLPVTIYRMTTSKWFKSFDEKLDWIYVDARHDHFGVLDDLRNCPKVLKKDGVIYGDDYGNKLGVVTAVDQFIEETGYTFNNFYNTQYEIKLI